MIPVNNVKEIRGAMKKTIQLQYDFWFKTKLIFPNGMMITIGLIIISGIIDYCIIPEESRGVLKNSVIYILTSYTFLVGYLKKKLCS
jgi:hypothetical protein